MRLVLDAEAVNALLSRDHPARPQVRRAMEAARRLHRDVSIASVTLAELYRGAGRNQQLDALLARELTEGLWLRDTDRTLARFVGGVMTQAKVGSELIADAHVVAVAVEAGGGLVLTGDPDDLRNLADPYRTVAVESVNATRKGGGGR